MSGQGRFRWKSGRLTSAPIQDFWTLSRTSVDPSIPNLPLESPPPSDLGGGGTVSGVTQPVFIEAAQDAVRSKHGALHLFRSVAQAAAAQVTPWFVWLRSKATVTEDEYYRPPKPVDLAAFRAIAAIVTVSSGGALAGTTQPVFVEADKDATRVDHSRLHRFRQAAVAEPNLVARVWALEDSKNRIQEESYSIPKPLDLAVFRNTAPQAPAAGQTWPRWVKPHPRVDDEIYTVKAAPGLEAFRQITALAIPAQTWARWVKPQIRIDDERDAVRTNHSALHMFRGIQVSPLVARVWAIPDARNRIEEESYTVSKSVSLHAFRQITIVAEPGQPWFMWPRAVADQTVEPNPVVINHAQVMDAFRPHQAVEIFEPPATPSPHGFEIRGDKDTSARKRQVPEVSRKPLLQRIMEARAEAAIQQVIAKPAKKNARKRAQDLEQKAAQLAVSGGQESEFFALLEKWLQQTPVYVDSGQKVAENDTAEIFMAQVALKVAAMQELEDERMIISLIQQGVI